MRATFMYLLTHGMRFIIDVYFVKHVAIRKHIQKRTHFKCDPENNVITEIMYEYDQEFYDERGYGGRYLNFRGSKKTKNDFAQEFFRKRRPKIKLYPGMPLKINQDQSRLANDLDHKIHEIKTSVNHEDDTQEQIVDTIQLDASLFSQIDLTITEQPRQELKVVMKRNKLVNVIDLEQEQLRDQLDIGKQKIKEDVKSIDEILKPTKQEIHHAIQALKAKFKTQNPFWIIAKLYQQIIIKKKALNKFLNPFWNIYKDELLINLFFKYSSYDKACYTFSLDHASAKAQSIHKRLQYLVKRGIVKYNQEVQVFKTCLANLNKINDKIINFLLENRQKLGIQIQVYLCKLYLSQKVDRDFFYELATRLNLFFKEALPVVRHSK